MSVINDALKRAKEVQDANPPNPGAELQFCHAEPGQEQKSGFRLVLPSFLYFVVLIAFLVLGVLFLRTLNNRIQVRMAAPQQAPTTVAAHASRRAKTSNASQQAAPVSLPGGITALALEAGGTNSYAAALPKPAPLTLQAVVFNPARPSAIIGGQTVFVGDRINEFHVARILRNSITLVSRTQTNVLKLPE